MSIYATTWDIDADDHADTCARWTPATEDEARAATQFAASADGRYWVYHPDTSCSCACGPLAYQGSHILPSDQDPRGGSVDLGAIPGFITRNGHALHADETDDRPYWPWLRLSVNHETVVLTRTHVTALRDELGHWLNNLPPNDSEVAT